MFEYGKLENAEHWGIRTWFFYMDYKSAREFGYHFDLMECLNELGNEGWQLSLKDEDSYLLMRATGK